MITLDKLLEVNANVLKTVDPVAAAAGKLLVIRCYKAGVQIVFTSGFRTYAEQDKLYAQGRTAPGNIVTNAKGGQSWHNFRYALDFAVRKLDGTAIAWDTSVDQDHDGLKDWDEVIAIAKALGFESGDDWKTFHEKAHIQMTGGLTLAQLRAGQRPTLKMPPEATSAPVVNAKPLPKALVLPGVEVVLKTGDNDPNVKTLQTALQKLRLYGGPIDGDYGTNTEAAVKAVQMRGQVKPVDGIYGPKTRAYLAKLKV